MASAASSMFQELVSSKGLQPITIDTVLRETNTVDAIKSKFRDVDMVITTRMHGVLLSLGAGKPVIALDQMPGGAKVSSICGKISWPFHFPASSASSQVLAKAFDVLVSAEASNHVLAAQARMIELTQDALLASANAIAES